MLPLTKSQTISVVATIRSSLSFSTSVHLKITSIGGSVFIDSGEWPTVFIPGVALRSLHEHQKILDLIKTGAYDQAKECLRTHIYSSFELIKDRVLGRE